MQPLLIDFECYFDKDFTLKKISTSEYIRDPRFHLQGASVRRTNTESRWLTADELPEFLNSIDWATTTLVAHHAQFDGFVLRELFGINPARYFCTRDAARLVFQGLVKNFNLDTLAAAIGQAGKLKTLADFKGVLKLTPEQHVVMGEYANRDADIGWALYELLDGCASEFEKDLIDLNCRLFCDPILRVDVARAEAAKVNEAIRNQLVIAKCGVPVAQLTKDQGFIDALATLGVTPTTKVTLKGSIKPAFAKTDSFMKDLVLHENEAIRDLANARVTAKSNSEGLRATRLINAGTTGDGTLPVYYNYHGAGTGRYSGGNKMNLQNLQAGSELRRSIVAPPGFQIGVGDSGQIECRGNAWLAGEQWILDAFANKQDLYCAQASDIYGRPITKDNATERFVGKTAVLGLGFTMGWRKFQVTLKLGSRGAPVVHMSDDDCIRVVNVYRGRNKFIVKLWESCDMIIRLLAHGDGQHTLCNGRISVNCDTQSVRLPSGREIIYPQMQPDLEGNYFYVDGGCIVHIHRGMMCENIVQAIARDIVAWQMLNVAQRLRVVAMTHDEIIALLPDATAAEDHAWMLQQMTVAPPWCQGIPLSSEGGYDSCYSK